MTRRPNAPPPVRPGAFPALANHERRIHNLEIGPGGAGAAGLWIYIGTPDQVAGLSDPYGTLLTDLIASNPPPFNTSYVAYNDPWIYSGGFDAVPSFFLDGVMVTLRGGFIGGDTNTVMFTLPTGFRPFYQQPLVVPTGETDSWSSVLVNPDGTVFYESTQT